MAYPKTPGSDAKIKIGNGRWKTFPAGSVMYLGSNPDYRELFPRVTARFIIKAVKEMSMKKGDQDAEI